MPAGPWPRLPAGSGARWSSSTAGPFRSVIGCWRRRRADRQRWADPGAAMAAREAALGAAALRRPCRAVTAELGPPPPPGDERRPPWCRAAAAIEAHRERFDLPDRPLELQPMARD